MFKNGGDVPSLICSFAICVNYMYSYDDIGDVWLYGYFDFDEFIKKKKSNLIKLRL